MFVTSTAEGNNDISVDKGLNSKTDFCSALYHFPGQAVPVDVSEAGIPNDLFSQK